ncbi:unnamed protein product [Auanema sp. JU1783]|nr:unnamed protein product [Auanema sp. JU1783]
MPKKVQPELIALYSLNVELALIRDKVNARGNNDTSGMYRLQFWKDSLSAIYGEANVPIPRQPVAISLCAFSPDANPTLIETLVTARQQTLGDKPFATVFELCGYGARTAGSLMQLTAESLIRYHNENVNMDQISRAASDIGGAYAILNLIRSTLPLLTRGVVLLPSDLLSLNNLTPDRVYRKTHLDDCKHVVKDMVRISEKHLASGRERVSSFPRSIRPAFIATTASADYILKMIKKTDYDIYNTKIQGRNVLLLWLMMYRKMFGRC